MPQTRHTAAFTTLLLAAAMTLAASPASAAAGDDIEVLTPQTATVLPGQTAWLTINLRGTVETRDVQVTAKGNRGVTAAYPSGRAYTSMWDDDGLDPGEIDYIAFQVTVPEDTTRDVRLTLKFTYVTADGTAKAKERPITLPVTVPTGADFDQVNDTAGPVAAGSAVWVEVDFRGARTTTGFQVNVTPAPGMLLEYPSGRTSTSLYHDTTLEPGETDYVAFRLDTAGMAPGTYELPLTIRYAGGQTSGVVTLILS